MGPAVDPKRTVKAVPTDEAWPDGGFAPPGSAYAGRDGTYTDHLLFACPGCGRMGSIPAAAEKPAARPSWKIEAGDPKDPTSLTLSPSIHCVGCCGWHGWLRNGVFESC